MPEECPALVDELHRHFRELARDKARGTLPLQSLRPRFSVIRTDGQQRVGLALDARRLREGKLQGFWPDIARAVAAESQWVLDQFLPPAAEVPTIAAVPDTLTRLEQIIAKLEADAELARLETFIAKLEDVRQDVPAELYESFNDLLGPACSLRGLTQQDEPEFVAKAFAELDALLTEAGFPPEPAEANRRRRDRLAAQYPADFFPGGRQRRRWWGLLVRYRSELRRALEELRPGERIDGRLPVGGGAGKPADWSEWLLPNEHARKMVIAKRTLQRLVKDGSIQCERGDRTKVVRLRLDTLPTHLTYSR